ncbi:MAG TPA: GNAT family N-acetyltransferase [Armatimonadota bacterium]
MDAVSPYGYPGFRVIDDGMTHATINWSSLPLVSIFVRDRVGATPTIPGGTDRAEVCVIDPAIPNRFREDHRRNINRNVRQGFYTVTVPGKDVSHTQLAGFEHAYHETMIRDSASQRYFFSSEYFRTVLSSPLAWLVLTYAPGGSIASASIAVQSDDYLHYYLAGTLDAYVRTSPGKNTIKGMASLSSDLSLPLHLGAGVYAGDSLEMFKRGFSNRTTTYYTHEIVCDSVAYAELCDGNATSDFFPAYRAPHAK